MDTNKIKRLNAALIITAVAIAVLGTALFLMAPDSWSPIGHGSRGAWMDQNQGQAREPGLYRRGYIGMHGMGGFGGSVFMIIGIAIIVGFIARRRHGHGSYGAESRDKHERDAISLLRHEFAAGRVSEEDYLKRLDALIG